MNIPLTPIDFTSLILGQEYVIKVKEDFFNRQKPPTNDPKKVFLIGTLDTFNCVPQEDEGITYERIRDRIYVPNASAQFRIGDETSFNNGKESKIQELLPKSIYDICFGTFVNVKQIDIEKTKANSKIITKDFEPESYTGRRILKSFIFMFNNGEINKKFLPIFAFYKVNNTSPALIEHVLNNSEVIKRNNYDIDFVKKKIGEFGGKPKKTKKTKKYNSKSRKQKNNKKNRTIKQ
jgi:hypothetical protein